MMANRQSVTVYSEPVEIRVRVGSYAEIALERNTEPMKIVRATIIGNSKEDPASEPDHDPNTWLLEAKLEMRILDWEIVQLDFRSSEIKAEVVESSMSKPNHLTIRTRGKSPLQKSDSIHVDIRRPNES
jgi:hypothetical protein